MNNVKVFVYGTLKSDGQLFMSSRVQSIKPGSITGKLYQLPYAWYPFANVDEEGIIHGEVHTVDRLALQAFDRIERGYRRRKVQTHEGEDVFVYHKDNIDEDFIPIESGVWEN